MTTLVVPFTTNFSATALSNINLIDFTNAVLTSATATFANTQFNNTAILDNVNINGSSGTNRIVVNGGDVNASLWSFVNWSASDTITINGNATAQNILHGSILKDTINGGGFEDDIFGEGGADILKGGASDDSFRFTAGTQAVAGMQIDGGTQADKIALNSGTGYDFSGVTIINVETLQFFSGAQSATFDASQLGTGKINTFNAVVGGPATVNIINASVLNLSSAAISGFGATDTFVITGTSAADTIIGSSANDVITGGDGADVINAGAGDDRIVFATQFDFDAGDSVDGGSGLADTLFLNTAGGGVAFTVATIANVERLEFGSLGGFGTFDAANFGTAAGRINSIVGGVLSDRIDVTGAAIDLSGVAFVSWSNDADRIFLRGTSGADTIIGSALDEQLSGNAGIDTMSGGAGNDIYIVEDAADSIIEAAGDAADRVLASVSYTLGAGDNIEFLEVLDVATPFTVNLTGNEFGQTIKGSFSADTLDGGAGADTLDGLFGKDTMIGGLGNDIFIVDNILDVVTELSGAGSGSDFINSSVTYTMAANTERLFLTGTDNINGTGLNGQVDVLTGNSGNNILNGLSGNDVHRGGLGNDTYMVDSTSDIVEEASNAGTDIIKSTATFTMTLNTERLFLLGAANIDGTGLATKNDLIVGNNGNNKLNGLTGNDTLTGGIGLDTFAFTTALSATTNHDTITDFSVADDTIQLENAIFTLLTTTGTLASGFFEANSIAGQGGSEVVIYDKANGDLYYDTNGAGTVGGLVLFADVANNTALTAADFVVV